MTTTAPTNENARQDAERRAFDLAIRVTSAATAVELLTHVLDAAPAGDFPELAAAEAAAIADQLQLLNRRARILLAAIEGESDALG
jgi:hypothetical protein